MPPQTPASLFMAVLPLPLLERPMNLLQAARFSRTDKYRLDALTESKRAASCRLTFLYRKAQQDDLTARLGANWGKDRAILEVLDYMFSSPGPFEVTVKAHGVLQIDCRGLEVLSESARDILSTEGPAQLFHFSQHVFEGPMQEQLPVPLVLLPRELTESRPPASAPGKLPPIVMGYFTRAWATELLTATPVEDLGAKIADALADAAKRANGHLLAVTKELRATSHWAVRLKALKEPEGKKMVQKVVMWGEVHMALVKVNHASAIANLQQEDSKGAAGTRAALDACVRLLEAHHRECDHYLQRWSLVSTRLGIMAALAVTLLVFGSKILPEPPKFPFADLAISPSTYIWFILAAIVVLTAGGVYFRANSTVKTQADLISELGKSLSSSDEAVAARRRERLRLL